MHEGGVKNAAKKLHRPSRGDTAQRHPGMLIRLTRKLAECVDGIDLSRSREGDVLDLSRHDAQLLMAEGWAVACEPSAAPPSPRADAPLLLDGVPPIDVQESAVRLTAEQLRRLREQMERRHFERMEERRVEDRIREELHDAGARIVPPTAADEPA